MRRYLEALVVFGIVLGVYMLLASGLATLVSILPGSDNTIVHLGGYVFLVGLFVAVGLAAHLVRRRLSHLSHPREDPNR
jgi:hypothetical protein